MLVHACVEKRKNFVYRSLSNVNGITIFLAFQKRFAYTYVYVASKTSYFPTLHQSLHSRSCSLVFASLLIVSLWLPKLESCSRSNPNLSWRYFNVFATLRYSLKRNFYRILHRSANSSFLRKTLDYNETEVLYDVAATCPLLYAYVSVEILERSWMGVPFVK